MTFKDQIKKTFHALREYLASGHGFEPKVTIIIPVFNKAQFLADCLDSVCRQTFSSIEVLCIDDCSTDGSQEILQQYACSDRRIAVFQSPCNIGPGPARNLGIERASAPFIMFLDADDLLPPDAVEILYGLAVQTQSDLVRGSLGYCSQGVALYVSECQRMVNRNRFSFLEEPRLWSPYFFQTFIYSSEFLVKHKISFPSLRAGEDPVFLAECLTRAESISTSSHVTYIYRTDGSASQPRTSPCHVKDFITSVELIRGQYAKSGYIECWLSGCERFYCDEVRAVVKRSGVDNAQLKSILGPLWAIYEDLCADLKEA